MSDRFTTFGKSRMASGETKAISPYLRCSEPLPSFLQGSLIWITQWQEFIDGEWRSFTTVRPRKQGQSASQYLNEDAPIFSRFGPK
jgi:hypothetical protein